MYEGQKEVEVTVTQGEDTAVEYVNKIATHRFELPEGRPPDCPIKVTFSYDVNQRMHCKFEDTESGRVLEVDFSMDQNGEVAEGSVRQGNEQLESLKVE
jgi:hypothetical protein